GHRAGSPGRKCAQAAAWAGSRERARASGPGSRSRGSWSRASWSIVGAFLTGLPCASVRGSPVVYRTIVGIGFAFACAASWSSSRLLTFSSSSAHLPRPRHFGKREHPSHGPRPPSRRFSGASHVGHGSSVTSGGGDGAF